MRKSNLRIGVDLMGSDTSPQVLFEAVLKAVELLEAADTLVIFSTKSVLNSLSVNDTDKLKIEFKVVKDIISMSDDPLFAVRHKKKSSIILGIKELKKGELDAFVSAGNTGALVAASAFYLQKLLKSNRPALLALLPTQKGSVAVIDVGGNISCKAEHLMQFAEIGSAYQSCNLDIEAPKVGLLNIGTESKKGTLEVQQAYQMLKDQTNSHQKMTFVGNIEGREVFQGKVDVLVTSGVTGNVLLKTAEGVAAFIFEQLPRDSEILKLQKQFSYAEYPGALIAGIDGIVIKSHGDSSARAMYNSIKGAITLQRKNFLTKMKERLQT